MLVRFEKGIYYIPTDTLLGKSKLDSQKVIAKKYINTVEDTIGYYSGITFLNMLGLSAQMPNALEIYTNNEPSRVRKVPVGNQKVILRRSRTYINSENAATMSFLELMNFTDASFYDCEKRKILSDFIIEKISQEKLFPHLLPIFRTKQCGH